MLRNPWTPKRHDHIPTLGVLILPLSSTCQLSLELVTWKAPCFFLKAVCSCLFRSEKTPRFQPRALHLESRKPLICLDHLAGWPVLSGFTPHGQTVQRFKQAIHRSIVPFVLCGLIRLNGSRIIVLILPFFLTSRAFISSIKQPHCDPRRPHLGKIGEVSSTCRLMR